MHHIQQHAQAQAVRLIYERLRASKPPRNVSPKLQQPAHRCGALQHCCHIGLRHRPKEAGMLEAGSRFLQGYCAGGGNRT